MTTSAKFLCCNLRLLWAADVNSFILICASILNNFCGAKHWKNQKTLNSDGVWLLTYKPNAAIQYHDNDTNSDFDTNSDTDADTDFNITDYVPIPILNSAIQ